MTAPQDSPPELSDIGEVFAELLGRVRSGDPSAAEELVRRFEPEIRLKVRTWMRHRAPEVRRVCDSMDVCQPVMANFFLRAAAGQFDLEEPQQLLNLLLVMARNELNQQVRWHRAQRRDIRRTEEIDPEGNLAGAPSETPSRMVLGDELLRKFRDNLSEEERRIADLRASGRDWSEVASELGGTSEGRRKQLSRALDRAAQGLGLTLTGVLQA